jgi:4-hydroxybenzoate polyprenyltransferase
MSKSQLVTHKWWIYQQERFPLVKNGLSMAIFSSSTVSHSLLLRSIWLPPDVDEINLSVIQALGSVIIAFIVLFLFAVQLRVVGELRDYQDNSRFHPNYPVQRGLITLRELGIVAIAAGFVQLGLTVALNLPLVLLLVLVWGYLGLLSQNFFLPPALKLNLLLDRVISILVMPLIALYGTACDWLTAGAAMPNGLFWFLAVSFFAGIAIEIGRNIRAPRDERPGEKTYTSLWGRQKAVMAWLGMTWLTFLATLLSGLYIHFALPIFLVQLLLLTVAVFIAWRFMSKPISDWAKKFELVSGVWAIAIYLALGIIPLTLK